MNQILKLKLITGITAASGFMFSYMCFNIPQEVKDAFNVTDRFWITWGWFLLICSAVWALGFIASFGHDVNEVDSAEVKE